VPIGSSSAHFFFCRNPFNRPRSISPFSSLPLEAVQSDTHTVTHSFYGHWVYPSSSPSSLIPLLGYSYPPLPWLAPYCPLHLSHGFSTVAARGCAQSSYCNIPVADVNPFWFLRNFARSRCFSGPTHPHCSSFIVVTLGFISSYNYHFKIWCPRQGFLLPAPEYHEIPRGRSSNAVRTGRRSVDENLHK